MRAIRRTEHDARVEMMPLIDVVFLLLTFFIYAMVLMIRAEVLPVPLESYAAAEAVQPRPVVSVTLAVDGQIYVGSTPTPLRDVVDAVNRRLMESPDAAIYVVMEKGEAIVDRGPLLTGTWDRLRGEGLEIFLVGEADDDAQR
ncbi:MAG: biopolymer transporter ExbD [Phycisphaerales bacterium]|jgi:biopolymer transport protein ExbD|nr:biopolymer transporter ExbD [Phycisphaerales bacterium]